MVGRCTDPVHSLKEEKLSRNIKQKLTVITRLTVLGLAVVVVGMSGCGAFRQFDQSNRTLGDARLWEQGGRDALSHGHVDEAKICLRRAINNAPEDRRIREQLADICIKNGEYTEAIVELAQAVDLSSNDPELRVKLGNAYLSVGKLIPATREAELALKSNRQLATAWELCGRTHWARGELTEALADFQRALSIAPRLKGVQIQAAQIHRQMRQPKRALSGVEQLLSRYPVGQEPQDALLFRGVVLMDLEQYESAMEKLEVAASRKDATSETFVQLSRAQVLAGQPSLARSTLTRAVERYPAESKLASLLNELRKNDDDHVAAVGIQNR
ncbi:MAG: tetratricopeptide repeat protein [Mariniblastus sp.]|nr:tetratricopeptide repeat protein [Mariniblastus sp.]